MKNIATARTAQKPSKIPPRSQRECFGCGDYFTCYQQANYDYCRNCAINGNRYIAKENHCPECIDGSGIVQFPNQKPRACKLCSLTKQKINCFYQCPFVAYQPKAMERHYRQEHYPKG